MKLRSHISAMNREKEEWVKMSNDFIIKNIADSRSCFENNEKPIE